MMERLLLVLALLGVFQVSVSAQEIEEELADITERLERAEQQRKMLKQRLDVFDRRVKLLAEARAFVKFLSTLDRQLEAAEAKSDVQQIEELEGEGEEAEFGLELVNSKLEILEHRNGVLGLLDELEETGSRVLKSEARILLQMTDRADKLVERLFRIYRDGPESDESELEHEVEAFHATFERRIDILRLKLELFWAREEGEDEAIRDLEAELKELGDTRDFEPKLKSHKNESDREETRILPPPMQLSADEVAAVGKLDFNGRIVPILKAACSDCHAGDAPEGGLDLETLAQEQPLVINRTHWINVIQQLKVRSMPPVDAAQPSESDRRTMVA